MREESEQARVGQQAEGRYRGVDVQTGGEADGHDRGDDFIGRQKLLPEHSPVTRPPAKFSARGPSQRPSSK